MIDRSWWFYPALVSAIILLVSIVGGIFYDSTFAFEIINFGLVAVIITYVVQEYFVPFARTHIKSEKLESAQLERQESSLTSQAQSLFHDAERLVQYNMSLEQQMASWNCSTEKLLAQFRRDAQVVQEELQSRVSSQMKHRLKQELQQRALCGAVTRVAQQLKQKYATGECAEKYIQQMCNNIDQEKLS